MPAPRRSFWFSRSPLQTQMETLLIGGSIWLIILIGQINAHFTASGQDQWKLTFYLNILCLFWPLLRIAPAQHLASKAALKQFFSSLFVFLVLQILSTLSLYLLLSPDSTQEYVEQFEMILLISICLTPFWLLFFTGLIYFLHFWNRLRQQSLQWALIHTHIRVIVVIIGVASLLYMIPLSGPVRVGSLPKINFLLLSSLFLLALIVILILILVLLLVTPPLALFAYFVTRPTIRRLAGLVAVTNELRQGHYSVRTPLEGKDEIAQLQKNFNSMADEL